MRKLVNFITMNTTNLDISSESCSSNEAAIWGYVSHIVF